MEMAYLARLCVDPPFLMVIFHLRKADALLRDGFRQAVSENITFLPDFLSETFVHRHIRLPLARGMLIIEIPDRCWGVFWFCLNRLMELVFHQSHSTAGVIDKLGIIDVLISRFALR